jgi:cytochrome P450
LRGSKFFFEREEFEERKKQKLSLSSPFPPRPPCHHQDRAPTLDDMPKLRWTTRVINESMRLYPQPPVLIRRAAVETKLVRGVL